MKLPCSSCGRPTVRKRLVIVPGITIRGKLARCCPKCFDKPDAEHLAEHEAKYDAEKDKSND